MIALGDFALLRPLWLLALPLPALAYALLRRSGGLGDWRKAVDPPLLQAMLARGGLAPGKGGGGRILALGLALVILALSGPALRRTDAARFRNLDALILVIDLSSDAVQGAALRQMKTAAYLAVERAGARQAAVVVYAGDAYLASGLTSDAQATDAILFALEADTVPDPGARPARALAMAHGVLSDALIAGGDVLLISSGAGLTGASLREARALADGGHRLHALALGPQAGALAALAQAGGGRQASAATPDAALDAIAGRGLANIGDAALSGLRFQDFGRWLLLLAALPLLAMFRRGLA